jgi:hypothetical protein
MSVIKSYPLFVSLQREISFRQERAGAMGAERENFFSRESA